MPTPIKYPELRNHSWVAERLQVVSERQLAEEIGCPHSCVRWIVIRYLTDDQRAHMIYERKPHKNWKPKKIKSNKEEVTISGHS